MCSTYLMFLSRLVFEVPADICFNYFFLRIFVKANATDEVCLFNVSFIAIKQLLLLAFKARRFFSTQKDFQLFANERKS